MAKTVFDQLMDAAHTAAEKTVDVAQGLMSRGKETLDRVSLENELAKAQRQLGTLVYSMKKAGEENLALVDQYVRVIAELEKKLEQQETAQAARRCVPICAECGCKVGERDRFCPRCGAKLF